MHRIVLIALLAAPLFGQEVFEEHVDVERVILDAYITDYKGNPVEGLAPDELEVRIGGELAEIEAVDWIPVEKRMTVPGSEEPVVVRQGRLIVLFFQTDFGRNKARLSGHMKIIPRAIALLDVLNPSDLVAVVQFDTHLKVRCDFTNDRNVLERSITESLAIDQPEPVPPSDSISLIEHFDFSAAKKAANPERALGVVASALNEIHGAKSLVMFGYGLGVYTKGRVSMRHDYELARALLESSRTTVFALDITEADYHTLEVGLQKVAGDTGGFYARTYQFPSIALDRLTNTLSGRYEIVIRKPPVGAGRHLVDVSVDRPKVYVQVAESVVIE